MTSLNSKINSLCLTPDQLSDLLIADDRTALSLASRRRHLDQCPTCRAEFTQLDALFSSLRDSTVAGSAQALASVQSSSISHGFRSRPVAMRRALWLATAAALALVISSPLLHRAAPSENAPVAAKTMKSSSVNTSNISDEALLEGISKDLSASVPSSLQPLDRQQAMDDDATVR